MTRRLLLLPVAFAASGVLLSGCGGSSSTGATTNPPAQQPPSNQAPHTPAAAPKPLPAPAAKVLQAFLRGPATDDTAVCKYVSPAYNKSKTAGFGQVGGCKKGIKATYKHLKPKQIKELKAVLAVKGIPGPKAGEYTVPFGDLKWTKGALAKGILADKYVIAKIKGKWLIVG